MLWAQSTTKDYIRTVLRHVPRFCEDMYVPRFCEDMYVPRFCEDMYVPRFCEDMYVPRFCEALEAKTKSTLKEHTKTAVCLFVSGLFSSFVKCLKGTRWLHFNFCQRNKLPTSRKWLKQACWFQKCINWCLHFKNKFTFVLFSSMGDNVYKNKEICVCYHTCPWKEHSTSQLMPTHPVLHRHVALPGGSWWPFTHGCSQAWPNQPSLHL